ncbi:MAG: hypothetical protein OXP09_11695 [Gammaproteobacteria bacterium]|nr:hypothetical protein [Gammaproteobacteria bacterium]MDE0366224.1 hypothetical protein [Gammaproteobacteria bacterium]
MSPEIWTIIGVGVAIAGLILNGMRMLRADLVAHTKLLDGRMDRIEERMDRLEERMDRLEARMDRDRQELLERIVRIENGQADLRERMARLQGLLEGLREAITRTQAA